MTRANTGEALVTILGDSRVFDTYFTNSAYGERYGYDATFPHLLRKHVLLQSQREYDVVHIPDHFRGGTVENNIIRLALTDPTVVVLCDGIWETLVHKNWFIEWATNQIRAHSTHGAKTLDLSYSSRRLADLFIANDLPVSPRNYAKKQARIISYFMRRRRQCVWMSLPMPPRDHLERLHYAGNYRCIPEWDECLAAINEALRPVVSAYGANWLDLHRLALEHGGFARALIDQWHFSRSFQSAIAAELGRVLPKIVREHALPDDHISHAFMLPYSLESEIVALVGPKAAIAHWRTANQRANVESIIPLTDDIRHSAEALDAIAKLTTRCVVAVDPLGMTPSAETSLLASLPRDSILLYPDELGAIVNPTGSDRTEQGKLL